MSIPLILADLSPQEHAVLLCFAFYLLNLLVPIVPAAFIYWLFPEGTTRGKAAKGKSDQEPTGASVEGGIGGWKIKAVGAWGAYVTAFLLGCWAINNTAIPLITAVGGASVWTINSDFKFTDQNDKEITDTLDKLQVDPPEVQPWGKHATITVFSRTLAHPDNIKIQMAGYEQQIVDLSSMKTKGNEIKLASITLKHLPNLAPASIASTPLPTGQGPAALTANK